MRAAIKFLVLLVVAISACNIVRNDLPLIDQTPILLKSVPNGQKLLIGDIKDPLGNYLYIANLKGTPKEMGKAYGELFAEETKQNIKNFYDYYVGQLEQILEKKIPAFISKKISGGLEVLLKKILDLNIKITKKYTNKRYYQEIHGIAEGSGGKIKVHDVSRLNMFPELIKAACTVAGVWKSASINGQTIHIRSLDWDSNNPISKFPVMVVYHPSDPKLHVHANFGWAGFVGSMTGISDRVSIGQKVWINPKSSVKTTRYGNPWTYVFRDVLYEANDIKSALQILTNTHRTCTIHVGLASVTDHSFRMFEYSEKVLNNYDDSNYTSYGSNHPKREGIAYFDKHVQPSGDNCLGTLFTNDNLYGKWDAESLYRYVGLTHQTGDTQLAVFDLQNKLAYVSYSTSEKSIKAFEKSPIKINLAQFFAAF